MSSIIAATGAAILAAVVLSWDRPGIGWLMTTVAVAAAALISARRRFPRSRRVAIRTVEAVAVVALIAVGTVRAAGWLFVLCVLTAALLGSVALAGRWSVGSLLTAPVRVAGSVPAAMQRLTAGAPMKPSGYVLGRTMIAGLITVAVLALFGYLLAAADAAFARVLSMLVPSVDGFTLLRALVSAVAAAVVTAVAAHALLTRRPMPEPGHRPGAVRRVEWALPVGGLVALFAGFVAVTYQSGDHVATTAGLTYAEHARAGFWQLLVVTGLTVIVVGVVARIAPRSTTSDRVLLRTLLGLLSGLALVIVASALSRMAAYEQAYGFTRLRLLVTAAEVWLGVVFLLIGVAGIRLRGRWVPRAALGAGVAALLGLAALNPDAFIAQQNANRLADTGRIDTYYLSTLSADAVPALLELPEPHRSCALAAIADDLRGRDSWREWNLGRATARSYLRDVALSPCPTRGM